MIEGLSLAFDDEVTASAAGEPIPNPGQLYIDATTKIDISGIPFASIVDSLSGDDITLTFSTPMTKLGPVPLGWATWSSPPFSESPNPDVFFTDDPALRIDLSRPVRIFGFELEPSSFATFTYTVDFFRGDDLIDGVSRMVDGNAGARLFARIGEPIDRVVINAPDSYAIAQIRLQQVLQEQETLFMLVTALLLLLVLPPFLL